MPILFAWDYHGTLAKNNELAVHRTLNMVFREFGIPKRANLIEVAELYGRPWGDYIDFYCPEILQEQKENIYRKLIEVGIQTIKGVIKPVDHAHQVLDKIKERGGTNIVISNMSFGVIPTFLDEISITKYIDHSIGISEDHEINGFNIPQYKARMLSEYAGDRFERIIMTGDCESDVEAGKLAGAVSYLFVPRGQEYAREDGVRVINDLRRVLEVYE